MKARLFVPFLRPIRGGTFGRVRTPRVPLRSTRGYSPLPLSGHGKGSVVELV